VNDAELSSQYQLHPSRVRCASVGYNSKTYADLADSPSLKIRQFTTLDLRVVAPQSGKWRRSWSSRTTSRMSTIDYAEAGGIQ